MAAAPQDFSNHARFVPPYHFLLATLILFVLGYQLTMLVKYPALGTAVGACAGVSLLLIFWYMRVFAVTVQDRVIRLEERLRMAAVLPAELQHRIGELTHKQLVALRFASDAELPALARRVLDEQITDQKVIKKQVTQWRADHLRA